MRDGTSACAAAGTLAMHHVVYVAPCSELWLYGLTFSSLHAFASGNAESASCPACWAASCESVRVLDRHHKAARAAGHMD